MKHKVAIVSTVKTDYAILNKFLNYHLNVGIDKIFLYFDDPNDTSIELIEHQNVEVIRCDEHYWSKYHERPNEVEKRQVINATACAHNAYEQGFEWLIHIDVDELLFPHNNIKNVLKNITSDAVRFNLLEAVSSKVNYQHIFQANIFRSLSDISLIKKAQRLNCHHAFIQNFYFRGHVLSKLALRLSPEIKIFGIHHAELKQKEITVVATDLISLLHFDCVGFDDWYSKWKGRADGISVMEGMRDIRKMQLDLFKESYAKGKNALLESFIKLHVIPKNEMAILGSLGMLKKINIPSELFLTLKSTSL